MVLVNAIFCIILFIAVARGSAEEQLGFNLGRLLRLLLALVLLLLVLLLLLLVLLLLLSFTTSRVNHIHYHEQINMFESFFVFLFGFFVSLYASMLLGTKNIAINNFKIIITD